MTIGTVLLVDDDANIRKIGQLTLSKVGHWDVRVAESGAMALAAVAAERPDLILMDVMMPGMDGPTTFKIIKQLLPTVDMPVIFLTAKVQKYEIEGYSRIGAAGVITKPFDPMTLPQQIREILAGSGL